MNTLGGLTHAYFVANQSRILKHLDYNNSLFKFKFCFKNGSYNVVDKSENDRRTVLFDVLDTSGVQAAEFAAEILLNEVKYFVLCFLNIKLYKKTFNNN